VDFIVATFALPGGSAILDMGCGTGRHAVALAQRGYRVTGVDIAAGMLAQARKAAEAAGVTVEWIEADATRFVAPRRFDAALCLCGGAFGILNLDDDPAAHDLAVLRAIRTALAPGSPLILTTLNAVARLREIADADVRRGRFDLRTLEEVYSETEETDDGTKRVRLKERRWLPPDLIALLERADFTVEALYGGTSGVWDRHSLRLDETEVMVIARARSNE
jgi:SAM-dependent methyltransferase